MHALKHAPSTAITDLDGWARHAAGANGFGEADAPHTVPSSSRREVMQAMMSTTESRRYA